VFASLAIVSFCLMLDAPTAHAAGGSYKVTSSGDQPDAHPGDGSCSSTALLGLCTFMGRTHRGQYGQRSVLDLLPHNGPTADNQIVGNRIGTDPSGNSESIE
jgi:hypothetical protein